MKLKKELRAVKEINDQERKKREDPHEDKSVGNNQGYGGHNTDKVYGADKMYDKADQSPGGGNAHMGGVGGHAGMMGMHVGMQQHQ